MQPGYREEVMARVCYHRGIGKENSLESIQSAIDLRPFLVEFDIQWNTGELKLGHPPDVSTTALSEVLPLFEGKTVLPKIDIKLPKPTADIAIDSLIQHLATLRPRQALINIAGEMLADEFMQAEFQLMNETGEHVLLNIDLGRYTEKSRQECIAHVQSLGRRPFSISPNLDDDTTYAIAFAKEIGILHMHFWSTFDKQYSVNYLYEKMTECLDSGLEVYFDIKTQNIIT